MGQWWGKRCWGQPENVPNLSLGFFRCLHGSGLGSVSVQQQRGMSVLQLSILAPLLEAEPEEEVRLWWRPGSPQLVVTPWALCPCPQQLLFPSGVVIAPGEAIEVAVRMAAVLAGLRALPAVSMGCQEAQPDVLLLQ